MEFAYNINSRHHCVHQNTSLTVVGVSPWRKWCYLIQLPCPFLVQIVNNTIFSAFQRMRVFLGSLIWLGETRSGSAGPAILTVWSHISSDVSYMFCRCSLLTILLNITSSRTLAFPPQLLVPDMNLILRKSKELGHPNWCSTTGVSLHPIPGYQACWHKGCFSSILLEILASELPPLQIRPFTPYLNTVPLVFA